MEEVKQDSPSGLILAGDGRADSTGHCAKFGVERGVVVAMELVQVSLELAALSKQSGLYACSVTRLDVVQKWRKKASSEQYIFSKAAVQL